MAFIAMVFASIFLIVVAIGLGILLIGVILDIVWGVRKHKEKKTSPVLKVFAVLLTVWGVLQGLGPIAVVGCMSLKAKLDYRAEISNLPKESIIHLSLDDDSYYKGFDLNGVHYVGSVDQTKQVIHSVDTGEDSKSEKIGALVYDDTGKHMIIEKIPNDLDANIVKTGTIYDPFIEESQIDRVNDYYYNEAPLYCEVSKSETDSVESVYSIDSDRVRAIRNYIIEKGSPYSPYNKDEGYSDGYMIFYSYDKLFYIDFVYKETEDGLCLEYLGDYAYIPDKDADYIRSIIND